MLVVKNLPENAGDISDVGSIPGLGRSPGPNAVKDVEHQELSFVETQNGAATLEDSFLQN